MNNQFFYYLLVIIASHLTVDSIYKYLTWHKAEQRFGGKVLGSLMAAIVTYAAVAEWKLWLLPLGVFIPHLVVYLFRNVLKCDKGLSLALEELLHLIFILLITWLFFGNRLASAIVPGGLACMIFVVAGYCTTTLLGSLLIELWVIPFNDQLPSTRDRNIGFSTSQGLKNGGKMIGLLERSLIYIFIMIGEPAAIGFLITAKSILRFGEIKDGDNRKEAEYIIIGTFMSFLFAVLVGYLTRYTLQVCLN